MSNSTNLKCPIRGQLNAPKLAKDGLTLTEEARRIEMLKFFLRRKYKKEHIAVETVILKLGESGRNKLRCDAIVYDEPAVNLENLSLEERLKKAVLIAEVKRDSSKQKSGIKYQLEPALRLLPDTNALGVYWDDTSRILFIKKTITEGSRTITHIEQDSIANLPEAGGVYQERPITLDQLTPPDNLVSVLMNVAHVMRSHGVNDEHLRYKETVKLILARYCDEREAKESSKKQLSLQVKPGKDAQFKSRIDRIYKISATRYSNAKTLFAPVQGSELQERVLRDVVSMIQGIHFTAASSEMMQQLFMSFVPAVFKKSLDQYFTPISLVECMVNMVRIGANDKVADPGMGTADFLTSALVNRQSAGGTDIDKRIFGMDIDPKAYDLAVINMILHKDGQTGLLCRDSIEDHTRWEGEINVALCNPPFGEKSIEKRQTVLQNYDLGHVWEKVGGTWKKTDQLLPSQQLGILFLERCYKMLTSQGGRLAIILPEGYLCTASYGYVRQWILSHLRIVSLVELPRRIFLKSDADLRSAIVMCEKWPEKDIKKFVDSDYPIHAELVRKVGYKLGSGFFITPKRDPITGQQLRDDNNQLIPDTDFTGVTERFNQIVLDWALKHPLKKQLASAKKDWVGARISDVWKHPSLDIKPRRLAPKALENRRQILVGKHVMLDSIADIVTCTIDLSSAENCSKTWRLVEGQDIRAIEGVVLAQEPLRGWRIAERKGAGMYEAKQGDIIIGLVRPERRNIGLLINAGDDLVASPDGVAIVRIKDEFKNSYPPEWLFAMLRSESSRLQFWTESGGTSYGKLSDDHIKNILLPTQTEAARKKISEKVRSWFKHQCNALSDWDCIGSKEDRKPILNSPIFGLEWPASEPQDDAEEESTSEA
ncbi:MAG: N-6 DNA methylase [Pseudomonadota bacterium]